MHVLDYGERWPMYARFGSLNCNTIMELELYCLSLGKWDEIPHVKAFRSLHNKMFARSRFQQLHDVFADLGNFSCQILSSSMVLPIVEKNKD